MNIENLPDKYKVTFNESKPIFDEKASDLDQVIALTINSLESVDIGRVLSRILNRIEKKIQLNYLKRNLLNIRREY